MAEKEDGVLESWKAIAHHFGVTVRTVQLWEQERGLPVRRFPGSHGRVCAIRTELHEWAARRTLNPETEGVPRRQGLWKGFLAASVLAVLTAGSWFGVSPHLQETLATGRLVGQVVVAIDTKGREAWTYDLGHPMSSVRIEELGDRAKPWAIDLDGDGHSELLVLDAQDHRTGRPDRLLCFAETGELRWAFTPGRRVATRKDTFDPPFRLDDFRIVRLGSGKGLAVVVVARHEPDYPQQTSLISPKGKSMREYWHSGHVRQVAVGDMDLNGTDEIYLAGVSNGYKAATLVVLDPLRMDGASREVNDAYQLGGFNPPKEIARILLPVSRPARGLADYAVGATVVLKEKTVHVFVDEAPWFKNSGVSGPLTCFQFSADLKLMNASTGDNYEAGLRNAGRPNERLTEWDLRELRNVTYLTEPDGRGIMSRLPKGTHAASARPATE